MSEFRKYNTLIFDCDGVILNSNEIKTDSFRKILKGYNQEAVEDFLNYHKKNGGISRYIKLENFLKNILPNYHKNYQIKSNEFKDLITQYSEVCTDSLCKSEVTKNLEEIKNITGNIPWIIVSGGDQEELKKVFKHKNIDQYFDGGIFGSPDKKIDILGREIKKTNIVQPALMFGDSKLDHIVSNFYQIDFIFVKGWTDLKDYQKYCADNNIEIISSVSEYFIR